MPELRTIKEAAPMLRSSTVTVRRLIHRGEIPYTKIGRRYLFSDENLKEFINRNTVNHGQENAEGVPV